METATAGDSSSRRYRSLHYSILVSSGVCFYSNLVRTCVFGAIRFALRFAMRSNGRETKFMSLFSLEVSFKLDRHWNTYLWDNSDVIDLFYHHLRFENIDLYVEHVHDEETGAEMEIGVDVEQSSDGDDFELVDARRKLKEFSVRHRLKSGAYSEVAVTSQTPVVDEAQLVDASGYETEYRYLDDEESLQSGQCSADVCSSSAHANASTAEAPAQSQANVCSSGAHANASTIEAHAQSQANSIGSRPDKRQASANVRGCSATAGAHIGCTATTNIRGCNGEANAFAKVCFDQGEGIYSAQASVIAQDRPQNPNE
ncbi:hypothetical protein NL676_036323 [Syzygium grande]|nr:hypothetical protein NL676_036323 [Syzygium grande]